VQTSPTRPERSLGAPVITRAATAVASRPRTSVAVLAAAFLLLGLALASGADAAVYWSNSTASTIGSANNDGTAVNQAFIGVFRPRGVASDGAHVYWTNGADIGRANIDGTGVNQNFITGVDASAVAVDAAHVYWDTRDGSIGRANLDGTGVNQSFIPQVGAVFGVAVDRAHVYWSTFGSIGRANLDGMGANQNFILFDPLLDLPCGVAVDAGHLYWANSLGTIGRANLDGTGADANFVQAGQAGEDLTCGVAVDSAHLYWARGALNPPDAGDGIGRANLDGTGANRTFITTPQPLGVAVDAAIQAAQPSRISVDDVSAKEGDAGQTAFDFTVSLDAPQPAPVTVDFATADGTATAPSDYAATRGTLTFAPGETVKTVTVQVNGDTTVEPDEMFTLNLSNVAGHATIADAQGVGTIVNDDQAQSRISINDVTITEGDSGQTAFQFTVSLDRAQPGRVTVDFATGDGTATAPDDYAATVGTLTFAAGETAKTVTVQVNGDTTAEPNETFTVNLSNAVGNATIADAQGVGTIVDDDQVVIVPPSRISITDVTTAEGNAGQTAFRFTVSLDAAQSAPITVDFITADGTATAPVDYAATNGTLTFAPGEIAETVSVQVNGDTRKELNETFTVNLSNAIGNATIADGHAVGTIVNDDRKRGPHKFALGKVRLNRNTGTARLAVTVPGPGRLAISGNGVKAPSAVVARSVLATGMVQLLIKASGTKAMRLNQIGAVTVWPRVTYAPVVGRRSTQSKNVRLEKF
jgi:Calx-beta domain